MAYARTETIRAQFAETWPAVSSAAAHAPCRVEPCRDVPVSPRKIFEAEQVFPAPGRNDGHD